MMQIVRRHWWIGALTIIPIIPAVLWWSSVHSHDAEKAPVRIRVDLSSRSLSVLQGRKVLTSYGIAVGRPSHPTPTGTFWTGAIVWNPSWTPPPTEWARQKKYQPPGAARNPMQAVKIYFKPPYYFIHGTNDPGSIGEAASHGCIRMTPDDARSLARRIQRSGGSVPITITH